MLLWHFVHRLINPTMTVGSLKLKDQIDITISSPPSTNIVQDNTWFGGTRDKIIEEEGDRYNE